MIRDELHSLLHNKLLLVVLITIMLIPSIYAGLFLASMWDPYGELEYLPVAVVNKDKPVEFNGSELAVGDNLADELKNNDSMAFNIVDADTAETGLKNGTYYMVVTIPESFSENATTLMDENPKRMVLEYQTNPGKNYIAMKMSESAVKEIKKNITKEITRTYAENVFDSIQEIGDGFEDAIDGTDEMIDGEDKLADGNQKITDNLGTLASSCVTFKEGADQLTKGTATLDKGVSTYATGVSKAKKGADKLVSNNKALNNGMASLSSGVSKLKSEGTDAVLAGLEEMQGKLGETVNDTNKAKVKQASDGMLALNKGIQDLNTAVSNADTSALSGLGTGLTAVGADIQAAGDILKDTSNGVAGYLGTAGANLATAGTDLQTLAEYAAYIPEGQQAAFLAAVGKVADDLTAAGSNVQNAGSKVGDAGASLQSAGNTLNGIKTTMGKADLTGTLGALSGGIAELAKNANILLPQAAPQLTAMYNGLSDVKTALDTKLVPGMETINTNMGTIQTSIDKSLVTGVKNYTAGVASLDQGLSTLADNNSALLKGTGDLKSGAGKLSDGAGKISDGAGKLKAGSAELGVGINKLEDGTKELNEALKDGKTEIRDNKASDATLDMFAAPVETEGSEITTVKNNGHAMAAYMMSVGLWVGCLAFCLMYPLASYKELKSGMDWWASKAVIFYPLAILMSVILMVVLHAVNGLEPESMPRTLLVGMFTSVAFMSLMYLFNMQFGKVGSFGMLIFMVLQLAGSAGTYPVEISGAMVPKLHKWMPFTYTVDAFRSAIAGGENVTKELVVLGTIAVVASICTVITFQIRARKIKAGKFTIYAWIEEKGLA